MKKICFLILFMGTLMAQECYQTYAYIDKHDVRTVLDTKEFSDEQLVNMRLHVRKLDDNGTSYNLLWLENGILKKDELDQEGIHIPFLVRNSTEDSFVIEDIISISKDMNLLKKLHAIVETMQFQDSKGIYTFNNAEGTMEVNQTEKNSRVNVDYLSQSISDELKYIESNINIYPSEGCLPWERVETQQDIEITNGISDSMIITDKRNLDISETNSTLDSKHWFLSLSTKPNTWGFEARKIALTLEDASAMFGLKEIEMKLLLDNREEFTQWVRNNMDFLSHLDQMLLSTQLDDEVSKKLFAKLGYINSIESSQILSRIVLNQEIDEKERFRSLMGLKNTSAPLDETLLDELITYGLDASSEDFVQNAAGMLLGTLAKTRIERSPQDVEKINNVMYEAVLESSDKRVVMASVGNMQEAANQELIEAVSSVLTNSSSNHSDREVTANAIEKLGKTNLNSDNFANLINSEQNSDAKASIIRASAIAKDFKSNEALQQNLLNLAQNKGKIKSNRTASLDALEHGGYGQSKEEKQVIRQMMLGERDPDLSKRLKSIYRR